MALLELIGRLGLNTQPFESGLRRARSQSDASARQIGSAFSRVGLGLLGISSIGGAFNRIVNQTIGWSRDIDAAREEFKRLGLEIDEGALRSIRETGVELERLKASVAITFAPIIGGLGKIFSMAGASTAALVNLIMHPFDKDRNKKLLADIERGEMAQIGATTPEEQKKFMDERLKKMEDRKREREPAPPALARPDLGALSRIGAFGMVAGSVPAQRAVEMIARATAETAKNTFAQEQQTRLFLESVRRNSFMPFSEL
jgi:hypothetical protein